MMDTKQLKGWIFQDLRWLKALCIVLPLMFLAVLEITREFYLHNMVSRLAERLIVISIIFFGVLGFSTLIFSIIRRLQATDKIHRRHLQSLNEVGLELSAEHQLEDILRMVVRSACLTIDCRYGALAVGAEGGAIRNFVACDENGNTWLDNAPPMATGPLAVIIRDGRSILIDDLRDHPQFSGFPSGNPQMNSLVGVPIVSRARVIGGLYLCDKTSGEAFTKEDVSVLSLLAAQSAISVDNAHLYERLGRLSALEERQRIAMDLHDGAIQSLYALGLQLESLVDRKHLSGSGHILVNGASARVSQAVSAINGVIKELRDYIFDLEKNNSRPDTISAAVRNEVVRLRAHGIAQIHADISASLTEDLDSRLCVIERALHECVSNVIRHSNTTAVSLAVICEEKLVRVRVSDNGGGATPDQNKSGAGHGLENIRKRLATLDGRLKIVTDPGKGYTAELIVPKSAISAYQHGGSQTAGLSRQYTG